MTVQAVHSIVAHVAVICILYSLAASKHSAYLVRICSIDCSGRAVTVRRKQRQRYHSTSQLVVVYISIGSKTQGTVCIQMLYATLYHIALTPQCSQRTHTVHSGMMGNAESHAPQLTSTVQAIGSLASPLHITNTRTKRVQRHSCLAGADSEITDLTEYVANLQPFTLQPDSLTVSKPAAATHSSTHSNSLLPSVTELLPATLSADFISKLHSTLLSLKQNSACNTNHLVQLNIALPTHATNLLLDSAISELHTVQHNSLAGQLKSEAAIKSLYSTIQQKQAEYEHTIAEQNKVIAQLRTELQSELTLHQQQYTDLSTTNQTLLHEGNAKCTQIEQLQAHISELQKQAHNDKLIHAEHAHNIDSLQQQLHIDAQQYGEHVAEMNELIAALQAQYSTTVQQLDQLTHSLNVAHSEIQSHHESQQKLNADASTQIDRIKAEYRTQLGELSGRLAEANEYIDSLSDKLQHAERAIAVLRQDMLDAVADVDKLTADNTQLYSDNTELKQQLDQATQSIVQLQTQISQLTADLQALSSELNSSDAEYNKLVDENKTLSAELTRVKAVVKQTIGRRSSAGADVLQPVTNTLGQ